MDRNTWSRGQVPTVLNGGLEAVPPTFWVAIFLLSGVLESWRMLTVAENPLNFTPGAIGFDPLQIYEAADAKGRRQLELKEINNGYRADTHIHCKTATHPYSYT